MRCEHLEMKYKAVDDPLDRFKVILNDVPKSVLNKICKSYNLEIKEVGISQFVEIDLESVVVKLLRTK